MTLPNLICPGAAKSGTTSLYEILIRHPDVFLSRVNKEAHFFDYDENYRQGLPWYSKTFFEGYGGQRIIGDITPSYMFVPAAFERIHRDLGPDTRFLFMLRHPVSRAYSQYRFNVKRSYETLPFEAALAAETERATKDFFSLLHFAYAGRSRYAEQLGRFIDLFGRERMLVLLFEEDFLDATDTTIRRVEDFLEIPHAPIAAAAHSNAASVPRSERLTRLVFGHPAIRKAGKALIPSYKSRRSIFRNLKRMLEKPGTTPPLDEETRRTLFLAYFSDDTGRLEDLIGRDLSRWRQ